jgi:NTE family protein
MRKLKVGLALGGGAARGTAHIGILKALERENIPIHIITGTSIGAVIGAMYASHPSAVEIERKAHEYVESKQFNLPKFDFLKMKKYSKSGLGFFYKFTHHVKKNIFYNLSLTKKSLISEAEFNKHVDALIDDIGIEETHLRFAAITLDITEGSEVILKTGSLRRAVCASTAIPGILPSVRVNGHDCVDGGWIDLVPVRPTSELGANVIIAVDVSKGIDGPYPLDCGMDVVIRAEKITVHTLNEMQSREADLVLKPDVQDIFWADFSTFDHCVKKGEEEVLRNLDKIKRLLVRKRLTHWF